MPGYQMLGIAAAAYLLGGGALLLSTNYRKWVLGGLSLAITLVLAGIALLTQFSLFSNPVEVSIINYTSRSGRLYFLKESPKKVKVLYEKAVNANEEISMQVEGEGGSFDQLLFLSQEGKLYQLPVQKPEYWELEVWEKQLKPAPAKYHSLLENRQESQQMYSIAIGLLLLWLLLYFFYLRWQQKRQGLKVRNNEKEESLFEA